jgi:hypothetical protein
MDVQRVEGAAEQLTDSTQQAFRMLADRAVSLQESNLKVTQNFFQNWIEHANSQAQGIRETTEALRDQGQQQREAIETLSQEGTNTYSEFLNSALEFYQEAVSTASQVAQGNMQNAAQATQQGMQAVSQAGQQAVQAASQAGQQSMQAINEAGQQAAQTGVQSAQQNAEAINQSTQQGARGGEQVARSGARAAQREATGVPIEGYDELKVGEVVKRLDNLSAEQLKETLAYERQNKNRDSLVEQIDRRIKAAS